MTSSATRGASASGPGSARRGRPGYDLDALVAAAAEILTASGFHGTSMEDLAVGLGVTKSAIYHHVRSKDELLELAVGRALGELEEAVAQLQVMPGSATDRLWLMVRRSVEILIEQRPYVALMLRVRDNTEVERRTLHRRRELDTAMAELVRQAAQEGSVRPDLDPALVARLIFGMVNSVSDWVRPGRTDAQAVIDAVTAVAFDGIGSH